MEAVRVTQNKAGEVLINNAVSYTPPEGKTIRIDLSEMDIKGYLFSHTEGEGGDKVFIYKPYAGETVSVIIELQST